MCLVLSVFPWKDVTVRRKLPEATELNKCQPTSTRTMVDRQFHHAPNEGASGSLGHDTLTVRGFPNRIAC